MKKSVKKIFALVLSVAFVLSVPFVSMAAPSVNVTVLDEPVVWTDAEPFIDANNRTLVPLRAVGEALGVDVDWDEESRTAIFSDQYISDDGYSEFMMITFPIGSNEAKAYYTYTYPDGSVDKWGDVIYMDTAAVIVNSRTYAPVRYLAEFFGYEVTWDPGTRTVGIGFPKTALDFNFFDWTINDMQEDMISLMLVPGTDYDMVKDFAIEEARVNDKPVKIYETNKIELVPEGVAPEDCYAIYIKGDFSDDSDLKISFDMAVNTTDTRTFNYTNTISGFVFDPSIYK